ncbi:MAG: hypothetical protein LC723_14325, partial [Actinobacteria bacterium]|nr:hypothetical protein [Actinomycetota bacterium]
TLTDGAKLVYRVSNDGGSVWSDPYAVTDVGALSQFSIVQARQDPSANPTGPLNSFLIAYSNGTTDSAWIAYRELTPSTGGGGWQIGPESRVDTQGVTLSPSPSIIDQGKGTLAGRKAAIGFTRQNLLGQLEFSVSFMDGDASHWTSWVCTSNGLRSTLASQGDRAFCLTVLPTGIDVAQWNGLLWVHHSTIPLSGAEVPSTVVTDDGTLHLTTSRSMEIYHASLPPDGVWSQPQDLGPGVTPVISTNGTSLNIYGAETLSDKERRIRPYIATDGSNFVPGTPMFGRAFEYVIDQNVTWAFNNFSNDSLFSFNDSAGFIGNAIGSGSTSYRLDSATKKLSLKFVTPAGGSISHVRLNVSNSNSPTYRIGLQSDNGLGKPSGIWVNQLVVAGVVVSGSFKDVPLSYGQQQIDIPSTALSSGTAYHVVVIAAPNDLGLHPNPSSSNWGEVFSVATDVGGEGDMAVLTSSGGAWTAQSGQVPFVEVGDVNSSLFSQQITNVGAEPATEYSLPGESFTASRASTPDALRLFVAKYGNPGSLKVRLIDNAGQEVWSAVTTPPGPGWYSVPVSGLALTSGSRYRLILDSPIKDSSNYWLLGQSSDGNNGWGGSTSYEIKATDRPGFNDRSQEAIDPYGWWRDIAAFNSDPNDALYLGDSDPFDYAVMMRTYITSVSTTFSYWNGSDWASLAPTRSEFGAGWGNAEWVPPSDWQPTSVNGKVAFWVRVKSSGSSITPAYIDRLSSIHDLDAPTVAPRGGAFMPLAWARLNPPLGIEFQPYDAVPPVVHMSINGGTPYSMTRNVHVQTNCQDDSGCNLGRYAVDSGALANFEDFREVKSLTLPDLDGQHSVRGQFIDLAGNATIATATTLLSTQAQSNSTPGGAAAAHGAIVHEPILMASPTSPVTGSADAFCYNSTCTMQAHYRVSTGYLDDVVTTTSLSASSCPSSIPGDTYSCTTATASAGATLDGYSVHFVFTIPAAFAQQNGIDYFLHLVDPSPNIQGVTFNPKGDYYWPGTVVHTGYQHIQVGNGPIIAHVPPWYS